MHDLGFWEPQGLEIFMDKPEDKPTYPAGPEA